jgi:hypothetical protein
MALTVEQICAAGSDEQLFKLLSGELQRLFPPEIRKDPVVFLSRLQNAPAGLRAMAATYDLDVSMAMDDLAWHFINHHRLPAFAEETILGLRELGATEAAEIFEAAFGIVRPHWAELAEAAASKSPHDWLAAKGIPAAVKPLNEHLWNFLKQQPDGSLLSFWLAYARSFPERCAAS